VGAGYDSKKNHFPQLSISNGAEFGDESIQKIEAATMAGVYYIISMENGAVPFIIENRAQTLHGKAEGRT
jgi:hypothetical protein